MPDNRIIDELDHKTREVINGIKGYLDLILEIYDDPLTTRQKKSLTIMRQQTDDLFQIIKEAQEKIVEIESLRVLKAAAVTFGHEVNNPLQTISMAAQILKIKCACPARTINGICCLATLKKLTLWSQNFHISIVLKPKNTQEGKK